MRLKFNGDVEVNPMEWLCIAMIAVVVVLLLSGKTDEAMKFVKDCWQLVKK
jgi:hypothetical protein